MFYIAACCRRLALFLTSASLVLVLVTGTAAAATAPTLTAPPDGKTGSQNAKITFQWSGDLQGDPDALNRSYFLLQVAPASSVPGGTNAEWPDTEIEETTSPGTAATSLTFGAPDKGNYRWRVCAMGVANNEVSNQIESLGCSTSRSLASTAATSVDATSSDRMVITTEIQRTTTPAVQPTPEPVETTPEPRSDPRPQPAATEPVVPAPDIEIDTANAETGASPVNLDLGDLSADSGLGLGLVGGVTGSLLSGLSQNIPGLPIPFWALILPMLTIPLVVWFRRSTSQMFDMSRPDGDSASDQDGWSAMDQGSPGSTPAGGSTPLMSPATGAGAQSAVKSPASRADGARETAA